MSILKSSVVWPVRWLGSDVFAGSRDFDPANRELMDDPKVPDRELASAFDELGAINRGFGGHGVLRRFLGRWFQPGHSYRILDLCSGAGDGLRAMVNWGRERDIALAIDAVDANPSTVVLGEERGRGYPEIHFRCEDALRFQPVGSYDLVTCSLALHHFSEEDAVAMLIRSRELSRRWVLVTDLERSPFTTAAIWLMTALIYRSRMTAHDGRMSARRAFSFGEFERLAEVAGWGGFGHARFLPCRQAVWLES